MPSEPANARTVNTMNSAVFDGGAAAVVNMLYDIVVFTGKQALVGAVLLLLQVLCGWFFSLTVSMTDCRSFNESCHVLKSLGWHHTEQR